MHSSKQVTSSKSKQTAAMGTSKRLPRMGGPTTRNIGKSGKVGGVQGTKTKGKFSTTNTLPSDWEREKIQIGNEWVDVTPLPLIPTAKPEAPEGAADEGGQVPRGSSQVTDQSLSVSRSEIASSLLESNDQTDKGSETSQDTAGREEIRYEEEKEDEKAAEIDLDKIIDIELVETETFPLFFLPSKAISTKDERKEEVDTLNDEYKALIQKKFASDSFQQKSAQTINLLQKHKEVTTDSLKRKDFECEVTSWMLSDAYLTDPPQKHEIIAKDLENEILKAIDETIKMPGTLLNAESFMTQTVQSGSVSQSGIISQQDKTGNTSKVRISKKSEPSTKKIEKSSSMMSSSSPNASKMSGSSSALAENEVTPFKASEEIELPDTIVSKFKIIERILTQNRYLEQQILYRNYPTIEFAAVEEEEKKEDKGPANRFPLLQMSMGVDEKKQDDEDFEESEDEGTDPKLVDLFQYTCPEVKDRVVSACDWNQANPDLLAVSYGEYDHINVKPGKLMFWTLKSPKFPEKIIETATGITSCKFSKRSPNLIATGTYDGIVAIYDVRKKGDKPVAESSQMLEKHINTVWEVTWNDQGAEKGENLVSIAGDGRIVQWSIKKGLECSDLLSLKKPTNPNQRDDKEGSVFRTTVGFTLDFPLGEDLLYLAGTEEGTVHKCSLSYNEELEIFWGHTGPVYKIRTSPFWPNIMASASADWTVQLWDWRRDEVPTLSCHSQDLIDSVNDIDWSPTDSCVFALAADDGRVELWDLNYTILKPLICKKPEYRDSPRTVVSFCKEYPVLISGNTAGVVDVYRLKNMEKGPMTIEEQRSRLEQAIFPNGRGKDVVSEKDEDDEEANVKDTGDEDEEDEQDNEA